MQKKTMIPLSRKSKRILRSICRKEKITYDGLVEKMIFRYSMKTAKEDMKENG